MAACTAVGYFPLTGGVKVETKNTSTGFSAFHLHYFTGIKTVEGQYHAATIRVYCGASEAPLPDQTLAFAVAKMYAPAGPAAVVELDALTFCAIPGDATADDYDYSVPDVATYIFGTGYIPSVGHAPIQGFKSFTLAVAEYVGGGMKQFSVLCKYPNTPRWRNTPIPRTPNCTQFVGQCAGRSDLDGMLKVDVEHVTLNLGPHSLSSDSINNGGSTSTQSTPQCGRKYQIPSASIPSAASAASPAQPIASSSKVQLQPLTSFAAPNFPGQAFAPPASNRRKRAPSPDPFEDEEEEVEDEEPMGKGKRKKKARTF
ncbi:hypothetical protein C8F01DRAFT_1091325 [Mycena amicta]|nr:hypothetical protein C8F01DRAFT_1091325 [Mycena amicta]